MVIMRLMWNFEDFGNIFWCKPCYDAEHTVETDCRQHRASASATVPSAFAQTKVGEYGTGACRSHEAFSSSSRFRLDAAGTLLLP